MKNITTCILIIISVCSFGQEWKWGTSEKQAKRQWDLLKGNLVQKKYKEAQISCAWLLTNTPDLHEDLYINALKIYEARVKEELRVDKSKRKNSLIKGLQDTVLMAYDNRIEYFGREAYVLNRKGKVAYKYLNYRQGQLPILHDLYEKIITLNGESVSALNITNFTRVVVKEYKQQIISKEEALKKYLELYEMIDKKRLKQKNAGKSVTTIDKNIVVIEKTFSQNVKLNCEDAHLAYEKKFTESPDLTTAKNIYNIMAAGSCTDDALYINAVEYLSINDPKADYFEILAIINYNKKDYATSYEKYKQSLEYTTDSIKKASTYYEMASLKSSLGKYSEARGDANTSLSFDPSLAKNHILIGNLYMSSYDKCKSDDIVKSRAVFIAAYNAYSRAGYSKGMANAKAQFPSKEELFTAAKKEGDILSVGCWIGGTVKAVKR